MIDQCPAKLFKYCEPARVDVIANARIRYSPLGAFNDPFEGRPETRSVASENEMLELVHSSFETELRKLHAGWTETIRQQVPLRLVLAAAKSGIDANPAHWIGKFNEQLPSVTRVMHNKFDDHLGALCLSEVPDSLLMWSHYASSHAGFVLEFDSRNDHFHRQESDEDELRHLRRIQYRDARPSAALSDLDPVEMFLVKSVHWAYEREWRMLHALS